MLVNEVEARVRFDLVRFGAVRVREKPDPAILLDLGYRHGPRAYPVRPRVGDEHGSVELMEQSQKMRAFPGGHLYRGYHDEPWLLLPADGPPSCPRDSDLKLPEKRSSLFHVRPASEVAFDV